MNIVECFVDFRSDFGPGQDDFARDKDEEDDFGLDHSVDESGKELRLVRAKLAASEDEALQADGEPHVARTDHVLNLEIAELCLESQLLDDARVLSRCHPAVLLRLGSRAHHLARAENHNVVSIYYLHKDCTTNITGINEVVHYYSCILISEMKL